jgi:hypothetical protein
MALSFGIYPAYPMVAFLPISLWDKAGAAVIFYPVSTRERLPSCPKQPQREGR